MWNFSLAPSPDAAPVPRPATGLDLSVGEWRTMSVPSNWQLDPEVEDQPIYCNYRYPIPGTQLASQLRHFPVPRDDNPVGSYQRTFELPAKWNGRRVLLQLDGADSNATVWVNGIEVGYAQDSRLPSEFDITSAVSRRGAHGGAGAADAAGVTHVLTVQVMRWCDGTYLEDQDHWRLSGLHRHVRLYSKPMALALVDYSFTTTHAALNDDIKPAGKSSAGKSSAGGKSPAGESVGGASGTPHDGIASVKLSVRLAGTGILPVAAAKANGPSASARNGRSAPQSALDSMRVVASLHGPCLLTPGEARPPKRAEVWRAGGRISKAQAAHIAESTVAEHGAEVAEAGGLLTGAFAATFDATLHDARLWSAEAPYLYTLLVELRDENGALVDCESSWVGLRVVAIKEGLVHLNGRPITFCGVNRHDHCPDHGKAVAWESMLLDAKLMKSHSINAVRCSHYPNDSKWLELCDAVGLYVVDEANVETHGCLFLGDEGYLSKSRSWRTAFVSRFARMVQRDKNHSCIVIWSLGNEAGYGGHHDAMAAWVRTHEPTRPVQYESCGGNACTDIICPMYADEAKIECVQPAAQAHTRASHSSPRRAASHVALHRSLCHVPLCHVSLCHVSLCHVSLCHVPLCHVSLCHVPLCHVSVCHTALCA